MGILNNYDLFAKLCQDFETIKCTVINNNICIISTNIQEYSIDTLSEKQNFIQQVRNDLYKILAVIQDSTYEQKIHLQEDIYALFHCIYDVIVEFCIIASISVYREYENPMFNIDDISDTNEQMQDV